MSSSQAILRKITFKLRILLNEAKFPRPFIPDADEPTEADASNEPYLTYYEFLLSKENSDLPQVISNSYGDDEQVNHAIIQD